MYTFQWGWGLGRICKDIVYTHCLQEPDGGPSGGYLLCVDVSIYLSRIRNIVCLYCLLILSTVETPVRLLCGITICVVSRAAACLLRFLLDLAVCGPLCGRGT